MYLSWLGKKVTTIYKDEVARLRALVASAPVECAASIQRRLGHEISMADLYDLAYVLGDDFSQIIGRMPQDGRDEIVAALDAFGSEPPSRLLGLKTMVGVWHDVEQTRLLEKNIRCISEFKKVIDETTSTTVGRVFQNGSDEECLVILKALPMAKSSHLLCMISQQRVDTLLALVEDPLFNVEQTIQDLTARMERIDFGEEDERRRAEESIRHLVRGADWSEESAILPVLDHSDAAAILDQMQQKYFFLQLGCLPEGFLRECIRECAPAQAFQALGLLPNRVRRQILVSNAERDERQSRMSVRSIDDCGFAGFKQDSESESIDTLMGVVRRKIAEYPEVCELAAERFVQSSRSIC